MPKQSVLKCFSWQIPFELCITQRKLLGNSNLKFDIKVCPYIFVLFQSQSFFNATSQKQRLLAKFQSFFLKFMRMLYVEVSLVNPSHGF